MESRQGETSASSVDCKCEGFKFKLQLSGDWTGLVGRGVGGQAANNKGIRECAQRRLCPDVRCLRGRFRFRIAPAQAKICN